MAVANTLAYYDKATITAVKTFTVQTLGMNTSILRQFVNHRCNRFYNISPRVKRRVHALK